MSDETKKKKDTRKRGRIRLSTLNREKEEKTMSITFGEEELQLTYNRSKYTPKFEKELKQMMDDNLPSSMMANMVFALLIDWNVEDIIQTEENLAKPEEEQEVGLVPLTLETFETLVSSEALSTIIESLADDNRPNKQAFVTTKDS